jgi:hypothetical protein
MLAGGLGSNYIGIPSGRAKLPCHRSLARPGSTAAILRVRYFARRPPGLRLTRDKEEFMSTPMKYLDRAMTQLRDLGLIPESNEEAPIIALLNRISDLDQDRIVAIARTLSQASLFNEVVREQVSAMAIGERYETITDAFDSIRKDAKSMVEQLDDGRISTWERLHNLWVKLSRGDISDRFEKIKDVYLEVAKDSRDQIDRERIILNAYTDFRGALKEAEVLAFEVLEKAERRCGVSRRAEGVRAGCCLSFTPAAQAAFAIPCNRWPRSSADPLFGSAFYPRFGAFRT